MSGFPALTLYQLKPRFQQSLRTLVDQAWRWGVTPNQITVTALLLSVAAGLLMAWFHAYTAVFLAAPVVLLLRMALNAMDGMLARTYQMQTPLGAILNELGDVLADAALYLPFATLGFMAPLWIVLIVLGAVCTEMTGVVAVQIGATRRYDGPLGKSDRALLFSLYALAIQWWAPNPLLLTLGAVGVLLLLAMTAFNRAYQALQEVKR